ncbi:MAG: hypothetical protein ABI571_02360 [Actinomycetota bacterium]
MPKMENEMPYVATPEQMDEWVRKAKGPGVSGDEAMVIMRDVTYGIPPEDSKLEYNAAHLRYRDEIERGRADLPPGTIISVPDL